MIRIENSVSVVHEGRILLPVIPCSFCFTDDSLLEIMKGLFHYEVRCPVCGHDGPHGETKEQAIDFWNKCNHRSSK